MLEAKTQLIFNKHQLKNIQNILLLKSNEPTKYGENFKHHNEFMSNSTTLRCFMPFQIWKLLGQSMACSFFLHKNIIISAPQVYASICWSNHSSPNFPLRNHVHKLLCLMELPSSLVKVNQYKPSSKKSSKT
jgi:hypothetical protein